MTLRARRPMCAVVLFLATIGCAPTQPHPRFSTVERGGFPAADPGSRYRVSVSSEGREVRNPEAQLVHRVRLTAVQASNLQTSWRKRPESIWSGTAERDSFGEPLGVRIEALVGDGATGDIGWRAGDLITAVGKLHTISTTDVGVLFEQLATTGSASVTLIRDGVPHKILYYVERPVH
ncbi:MAG: hypothetical protein KDD44_12245 [Bdellovibrionales bacterium]|nr:hypothetical protein [Bdellovibrionales bacterium]